MAAFLSSTLATPIVQEREWAAIAKHAQTTENPLATLLNHRLQHPIGTGPFTLAQWRQGAFLHLKKNPHFFADGKVINGMRLGPFVDDLIYSVFGTSDVAILALKKGSIDMFWCRSNLDTWMTWRAVRIFACSPMKRARSTL